LQPSKPFQLAKIPCFLSLDTTGNGTRKDKEEADFRIVCVASLLR